MTITDIYVTLVQFLISGIIVNAVMAVLIIVATVCEYLRGGVPFESMLEDSYRFYLESFLPTMFLLMVTTFALKVIGGY